MPKNLPNLVSTTESKNKHSSAVFNDGIVLLGGDGTFTTEVIPVTGDAAVPGTFAIKHGRSHCTIDLQNKFAVITGGYGSKDLVTDYALPEGTSRALPPLHDGRWGHACSWYPQGQNKVGYK